MRRGELSAPSFGEIAGFPEGTLFEGRKELHRAGVHRQIQAGISWVSGVGADSIVLSGGYEDDEDLGDLIVYTGHGGNNPRSGRQVENQEMHQGNLALAQSCESQLPVRVVRAVPSVRTGTKKTLYRYDGLFLVERYWPQRGRSGFLVFRYQLRKFRHSSRTLQRSVGEPRADYANLAPKSELGELRERVVVSTDEIAQVTLVMADLLRRYDRLCQICGSTVLTLAGPFARIAFVRPLGTIHGGLPTLVNALCLCPNHEASLTLGGFVISDELNLLLTNGQTTAGRVTFRGTHRLDHANILYHSSLFIDGVVGDSIENTAPTTLQMHLDS